MGYQQEFNFNRMEATELMASPDSEQPQSPAVFQTVRVETETLPPLVELGRKLLLKAQEGDAEAVRDLLKQGAPFTTDWLGTSAIHWACQLNHVETVDLLLKAGISRDARNKVDRTPLHVTAQEGHVEILKLLLAHGVDVDATDMLWMTPLHWAAEYGHEECVRLLLQHGADPVAINKFDKTPDHIAFDNNRLDITHIIQEYAENPLRHQRRIAAKERQKQAAAAHKAAIELEKCGKTLVKTMFHTDKSQEHKEVRILKFPKRKTLSNKMVFESSLKVSDNDKESTPAVQPQSIQPTSDESTEKTLRLLQAHGITMLPTDNNTIVESAVQSGHNVVLTEAGKLALNQTKKPLLVKPQASIPVKGLIRLPEILKGKKVITIRADQLISMKNERKVVIQTDKKFNSTVWSKPKTGMVLNKPKFEVIVKKTMVNNKPFLTSSVVQKPVNGNDSTDQSTETQQVSRITEETEMESIKRELEECKREMKILREQYSKKEKEANEYKLIADTLRNSK